jgi:hypothetical protein
MYDITLYGHLTVDRIFDGFVEKKSLGAMANMWRTFKKISPNLNIGMCPTSIGEAIIYIDRDSSTRFSNFVNDIKTQTPIIKESKISHALYINKLNDTTWIKNLKGTVSADVCAGSKVDVELLKNIDYLFISDEDAFADVKTMAKLTRGYVILHSNKSSIISNGQKESTYILDENLYILKSNVLGAGDMFASIFLKCILEGKSIEQCQQEAHESTSKLIKLENEKI